MKASIYIPTYGRCQKQITFLAFSQKTRKRVIFVIKPEEKESMVDLWGTQAGGVLVVNQMGIAVARQEALKHSKSDSVLFFDDDLHFSSRVPDWNYENNNKAVKSSPEQIDKSIIWMEDQLSHHAMAGLGPRGGNNRCQERLFIENTRMMRSFGVRRSIMNCIPVHFDDFFYWEDFHVCLTLLEFGYPNRLNVDCITDGVTNTQGGITRHIGRMWKHAKAFHKQHPMARIREKTFKEGSQTIKVPDFVIAWKKSFESRI